MANLPSPIQQLDHPILKEKGIQLYVKREDLIHEQIMGNKWRKLKYNLEEAARQGKKSIVTLGGAFSNHIYATAAAGKEFGFETIGIIRGEELDAGSNPTLEFAKSMNMDLRFVDRSMFRELRSNHAMVQAEFPERYYLPEGGTNRLAIKGCKELVEEISIDFDVICCPIGTGGTFSGVLSGVNGNQHVLGISSLKGEFIVEEMRSMLEEFEVHNQNYAIDTTYHFGGYGKTNGELVDFINWFKENFHIPLDPIYTGKCFFAVWDMIKSDKFEKNLRIILLHTGGLQGISGFNRKNENIIQ